MFNVKGFVSYPALYNNAPGAVAAFGELSKEALTYTIETGVYRSTMHPSVLLSVFKLRSSEGLNDPSVTLTNLILEVSSYIYGLALSGTLTDSSYSMHSRIADEFYGRITDVVVGDPCTDGALQDPKWMPEWIEFRTRTDSDIVHIWFSDAAFQAQYDEYEYLFVSPVLDLDVFFRSEDEVRAALAAQTVSALFMKIEVLRGENPFTLLKSEDYNWHGSNAVEIPVTWPVLIYGQMGDSVDSIRLALIDWILAHSNHTQEEWLTIFPQIFTPTEFVLIPLWNQFAIPNQTVQSGINSPWITARRAIEVAETFCTGIGYESDVLDDNTMISSTPYQTLGLLVVGNAYNANGICDIRMVYPDYVNLPLTSPDIGRLSVATQRWMYMLAEFIKVAESVTEFSSLPFGYGRTRRGEHLYVAHDHEGYRYIMVSRLSLIAGLGLETPYVPEYEDPGDDCSDEAQLLYEHLTVEPHPHGTTPEQVGLSEIENLLYMRLTEAASYADVLVEQAMTYSSVVWPLYEEHMTLENPHAVLLSQLGLGSVMPGMATLYQVEQDVQRYLNEVT